MGFRRQAGKQFGGCGVALHLALGAGGVVDLDDAMTVGGVGKLEAKNLRVLARLLHAGFSRQTDFLGLDDR